MKKRVLAGITILLILVFWWLAKPVHLPVMEAEVLTVWVSTELDSPSIYPETDVQFYQIPPESAVHGELRKHFSSLKLYRRLFAELKYDSPRLGAVEFEEDWGQSGLCMDEGDLVQLRGNVFQVGGWKDETVRAAWFEKLYDLLRQAEEYRVN